MLTGLVYSPGISAETQPRLRTLVRSTHTLKEAQDTPQDSEGEREPSHVAPQLIQKTAGDPGWGGFI